MTEPATRNERKERTRRALLDTALELLTDRGFAGLSLREVTKGAGIVPTAFYRHFASMDDLGIALVEESARTLHETLRAARRAHAASGDDVIAVSVRTLTEQVRAHEAHFRFLARQRYGGTDEVARAINVELRLFASGLAVDLARYDYLRDWSNDDLHMLAGLVVTAMLGTVLDLLEARGDGEAEARVAGTARKRLRLIGLGVPRWRSTGD
ncbi:DNA-binding transcriptional regulator, AcrR family [Prauserella marina]|uniref:DNA-binding transcriptional regulator, AcrR family n=1 Tax=Prauserella marina TaxID=530584 RepID=A0A1G6R8F8_9PSEU|nr:TetR family transcriptional regulator [Prauserella marina]SDD00909.1 DNA-binding transcriptional regulator, AcrR family [Prauserella marina]